MSTSLLPASTRKLSAVADFNLLELASPSGLRAQILPSGSIHAFRHGGTLLNQLLPGPAEDGLFRLLLRWRDHSDQGGWAPLVGPMVGFARTGPASASWTTTTDSGLACTTVLQLHPRHTGWAWRVSVRNAATTACRIDVLHAQDLGLADEAAVRSNEAYVSQYIDLLPVEDAEFGPMVFARQNQPMTGGRRPWLALACVSGAAAYCTDGSQFFGADHRLAGVPEAVRRPTLPSRRLQYEFALGGLQSRGVELAPGAVVEVLFAARYVDDHPAASHPGDVVLLRELLPIDWIAMPAHTPAVAACGSVFVHAPWLHGSRPSGGDWAAWFPGARRHEEADAAGNILSFFHGPHTHVVSLDKEAAIARPHGHVLRSGAMRWIDDDQFGLTCYAAGVFGAQAYLGNPNIARLLSVVRNHLNVARSSGQRLFVRRGGTWCQLGIPSAFAMDPGQVRWIYRLGDTCIEARVWCSADMPASFLDVRVAEGPPQEFLVTHQLALGANEFDGAGVLEISPDGWIGVAPGRETFTARHLPGTCFAIVPDDVARVAVLGGDELIRFDGASHGGPYAAVQTTRVARFGLALVGGTAGMESLLPAVRRARMELNRGGAAAVPPASPVRLHGTGDVGVSRVDEVLPWFTHNAAIHFSAPHGLEQYGGAAWGVRDVTQGSLEWLLAAGDFATARQMLTTVFAQHYAHDGSWPQWFMFPPFRFIQQAHSHGDVCLWPVKALCDYVEASNDFAFLDTLVGYTDHERFEAVGPAEDLWSHCDRVVRHVESRFVPGTALINYGDGDWDDTLQPADPAMRSRMISSWTVALAYHTFRLLAEVYRRGGRAEQAARLDGLLRRIRADFAALSMPDGVVAGFLIQEGSGVRALLHPRDAITGIRHRLLPMTRSILAGLFTPEEAARHAAIIDAELRFVDGVRLMSEPVPYRGGVETLFKRADTAANVGREIGLQYVHAHLRYAEAMARLGLADRLWTALQVVNPVALEQAVPGAVMRQSNVYFSSSDADFADRVEAAERWPELRAGRVPVRGGWRLYSSGPGLYLHKIRSCLLGLRESFGEVVFDPVLPRSLDGLRAEVTLCGRPVTLSCRVCSSSHSPGFITVNGQRVEGTTEANPYRKGGLRVALAELAGRLTSGSNRIEIAL